MNENQALPEMVMPHCPLRNLRRGQKAQVTGASSGIGKSVALYLAQEGADVAVNYVGGEDADASGQYAPDPAVRSGLLLRSYLVWGRS